MRGGTKNALKKLVTSAAELLRVAIRTHRSKEMRRWFSRRADEAKALNESVGSKKETMPFLLANTSPAVERNRRHARQNDMPRRSKHDEYSSVMRQRETLSPSPVNCQNVTFTPPYAATGGAGTIDRGLVNSKPGPTGSVGASSASNNVPNSPYRWSKMLFTKP